MLAAGCRVLIPDLIGFGRSDKPTNRADYSYERHTAWLGCWFAQALDPDEKVVLFCQDWGGLLGLRLVASSPTRFLACCAANTFLPTGLESVSKGFMSWLRFSQDVPVFEVGAIVSGGTVGGLDAEVMEAYDAPFMTEESKAGARAFPPLVPITPWHPGALENSVCWSALRVFDKPFVTCFSDSDPVSRGGDRVFQSLIPGAKGQPHTTVMGGGHFLQEDKGEELAAFLLRVVQSVTKDSSLRAKL